MHILLNYFCLIVISCNLIDAKKTRILCETTISDVFIIFLIKALRNTCLDAMPTTRSNYIYARIAQEILTNKT